MPSVVWFKRDLRTVDHAPLCRAVSLARRQEVVSPRCLYVVEPGLWAQPDASARQWAFVRECLQELEVDLLRLGLHLYVHHGEMLSALEKLWSAQPFDTLFAHEETGNAFTYARDMAVNRWCQQKGVQFVEVAQFGVVRRLSHRDGWHKHWQSFMDRPLLAEPAVTPSTCSPAQRLPWPSGHDLGLITPLPRWRQTGGRREAMSVLHDFLHDRCGQYRGGISSPLSAPSACSRLSPYLAWGCLSMRETVQATQARITALEVEQDAGVPTAARQRVGLTAFLSRLHWHCHFIQKLESEPELEWRNLHRGYDGLREPDFNEIHYAALTQARTGWPLVDACVVMLLNTGWLNFRMRAMLVSVASYALWLHWRPVGEWLAQQFVDYEPGIHWSQMQMQAGTTGINTTRVYNPIKQAQDHDPQGHFVRRWLPAMRRVPNTWLFEPWLMPPDVQAQCGVIVGEDWPHPLVDLAEATRTAKARVHGLRKQPSVKAQVSAIVDKHGSRLKRNGQSPRSGGRRRGSTTAGQTTETVAAPSSPQLDLFT